MNDFETFVKIAEETFEFILWKRKIPERFFPELEQVLYDTLLKFYKKREHINSWSAYFKTMLEREIMKELKMIKEREEEEKILLEYYAI